MDYSQLEDTEITIRVGETFGWNPYFINEDGSVTFRDDRGRLKGRKNYCNNPADAWPIILEHGISVAFDKNEDEWVAWGDFAFDLAGWDMKEQPAEYEHHVNPLRAAMIVFLMMQESQHA
ncbi:phage protein NinX family protein [Cronobacter sakazakii]|uniref:phage protein NinX family protein n=1 Tax=Cronobacter sakazakii TaxID=28141 RepID=UPI000CFB7226|nr:phage protein NinX family protein [Cronobacter sakazakii]PQY49560.1 protein ninX [Cronobacter sakazakii]